MFKATVGGYKLLDTNPKKLIKRLKFIIKAYKTSTTYNNRVIKSAERQISKLTTKRK